MARRQCRHVRAGLRNCTPIAAVVLAAVAVAAGAAPLALAGEAHAQIASPTVLNVGSPDGTYGLGNIVAITVRFSEAVSVDGTPALALATDPPRSAPYGSGSGTQNIVFWYAPQVGDSATDLNYVDKVSLSLNGGRIVRTADGTTPANTTLPPADSDGSLGQTSDVVVSAVRNPVLVAAGEATDNVGNFELDGARGIDTFAMGGQTYAVVAAEVEDAVQLIRIAEDGNMTAVATAKDGEGSPVYDRLNGARDVDAFAIGDVWYAVVAARHDDGVQLIRIGENGALSANASTGTMGYQLNAPTAIDTFEMGGVVRAIATARQDNALQMIHIGMNGAMSPGDTATWSSGGTFDKINGPDAIDIFAADGTTYAIVAGQTADSVQLIHIDENGAMTANGSATDSNTPTDTTDFEHLESPAGVRTFIMNGERYAVVTSEGEHAVQLIHIGEGGNLTAGGTAVHSHGNMPTPFKKLLAPKGVDTFTMSGVSYAIVASSTGHGVQLIRVNGDGTLTAAGSAADGTGGFAELRGATGIDAFAMGGATGIGALASGSATHAIVASETDDGVQMIRLFPTHVVGVNATSPSGNYGAWQQIGINVTFSEAVTVAGNLPELVLATGSVNRSAAYAAGNGSEQLEFVYTVVPGDSAADLDYAGQGALRTRGAIAGAGGTPAYLGLPAPGERGSISNSSTINIATSLGVAGVGSPDPDGAYGTGRIVAITVEFSGAVDVAGNPVLDIATVPPSSAVYKDGSGTRNIEFWYEVGPGIAAADLDYAGTDALRLNGGSIVIAGGSMPASTTLPQPGSPGSLGASKAIEIGAGMRPFLAAADSATDLTGPAPSSSANFTALEGAKGVATFEAGGAAYALVASFEDSAVQMIKINDDGTLSAGGAARDSMPGNLTDFTALGGATGIDVFDMGGATYAIVASNTDNAVQLIHVDEEGRMTAPANGTARHGQSSPSFMLVNPRDVAAFEMGGRTFAVVAATGSHAVQLIQVNEDGTLSVNGTAIDDSASPSSPFTALWWADAVDTIAIGGRTFAVAAALADNAVQLIQVNEDGTLSANGTARDSTAAVPTEFTALWGATGVDAFALDGVAHAMVASYLAQEPPEHTSEHVKSQISWGVPQEPPHTIHFVGPQFLYLPWAPTILSAAL